MKSFISLAVMMVAAASASATVFDTTEGKYQIKYDDESREMTILCDGTPLFNKAFAEVVYNVSGDDTEYTISTVSQKATVTTGECSDCFGNGRSVVLSYNDGLATMRQIFNFYNEEYFICQAVIEANDGKTILQSRRMIPLAATETYSEPFNTSETVRMIWVPFDNDGHGRYHNYSFLTMSQSNAMSHEVAAAFVNSSRRGLVAGSVDHDKWKSGVEIYGRYGRRIYSFQLLSGLTNATTRDALPHGKVKGISVSSARYMVGMFDDWRNGLNTFGDCCNAVVPRAVWEAGNPVGWSSYGVQQERVNEQGVVGSSCFLNDNFRESGFCDAAGQISVSLDAFGNDHIPDGRLKTLIKDLYTPESMVLGLYAGPLNTWEWALDGKIEGTGIGADPVYKGINAALKVNGEPYRIPSSGAYALDPTHPAVRMNINSFMNRWAKMGIKYVKADFLNGGIIEGDSWYDPEITTGVMAYNYGMKMLYEIAEANGIYVVEAMSPLFPYQYAHGRRTCCDRFSKIDETEYVMNAISYGWWTDRLYTVNDPDQLVLLGRNNNKSETLGENRARATSGMVTGAYIWGDNFSEECVHTEDKEAAKQGVQVGDPVGWPAEARERAMSILGNRDINDYVRTHTGSFMPVEGGEPTTFLDGENQQSEHLFYRIDERYCYVAAFSFSKKANYNTTVTWQRLGISDEKIVGIKELWTGQEVDFDNDGFDVKVPKSDACVYRIELYRPESSTSQIESDVRQTVTFSCSQRVLTVKSAVDLESLSLYDVDGNLLLESEPSGRGEHGIDLGNITSRVVIVKAVCADGHRVSDKIAIK